jgi:hypothetical protein
MLQRETVGLSSSYLRISALTRLLSSNFYACEILLEDGFSANQQQCHYTLNHHHYTLEA